MRTLIGIFGAAFLFGLLTLLRARDRGCSGNCVGCGRRTEACQRDGAQP